MIIGLIEVIGLIAIMDRYLEFANHSRDFAASELLRESQTCLVKDATKKAVACSKFRSVQQMQEFIHGMKLSHRLACYKFLHLRIRIFLASFLNPAIIQLRSCDRV